MNKLTLIFDLDGTLVDSWQVEQAVMDRYCSLMQYPESHVDIGPFMRSTASMYQGVPEWSNCDVDEYQQRLLEFFKVNAVYAGLPEYMPLLYAGVKEVLRDLYRQGAQLAIFTANDGPVVERVLNYYQLTSYFHAIFTSDRLREQHLKGKPSADIMPHIIDTLHLDNLEHTYYVGDSLNDLYFAQNAGIKGIFAEYGYSDPQSVKSLCNPDYTLTQITDLRQIWQQLQLPQ